MLDDPFILLGIIWKVVWAVLSATWWFLVPAVLVYVFLMVWLMYINELFRKSIQWTMLEIRIPKNVTRTPKAMEQVFGAYHSVYDRLKWYEIWWQGKIMPWMTFEVVGYAGGVYFYARVWEIHRNLIEAAIYAQYPDAEITTANDYTELMPANLPNQTYDIFGTNFKLAKDDAYPIRTYEYFEHLEEERRLDPMAPMTEAMSKLKEGEMIWIQYLIEPIPDAWKKKADDLIKGLMGLKKKEASAWSQVIPSIIEIFSPAENVEKRPESTNNIGSLTQNQRDVIKGMEEKTAKLGFKTNIRFIFIDNREHFTKSHPAAIFGTFMQFNTQNMNALIFDKKTFTKGKWPFKKQRELMRKKMLYENYLARAFVAKTSVLNTEELATVFHFPSVVVEAPKLTRIEAKKSEPPPNLPIAY